MVGWLCISRRGGQVAVGAAPFPPIGGHSLSPPGGRYTRVPSTRGTWMVPEDGGGLRAPAANQGSEYGGRGRD